MNLSEIAQSAGRRTQSSTSDSIADIITFIEAPWGLGMTLFPVQRVILKVHYGLVLDENPHGFDLTQKIPLDHPEYSESLIDASGYYKYRVPITDWRRENLRVLTEAEYLKHLYEDGRCNIEAVVPGDERREMMLSIGRRSGKTTISACIAAYESYKLVCKGHPQKYYGLPDSNVIQIISVATDQSQAGLLYREVHGHFVKCDFFTPYIANATQSYATIQTPYDIDTYGTYASNQRARCSVRITFKSCIAKGLRGAGNIVVILDEVAHFTDAGQSSAEEVYNAVKPSTAAYSQKDPIDSRIPIGPVEGRTILISSPLGKQGLFYNLFQVGMSGGRASRGMLCVEAPTWEVNPTVPVDVFEVAYAKNPGVFFTEYGGQFTDRTKGFIESDADLMACVDSRLGKKTSAPARSPHFMGVDIALVGDYSAIAVGHIENGRIVLDYADRIRAGEGKYLDKQRLEFDEVADWIADAARRFYISEGIFDQWSGIPMEQALAKKGLSQLKSVHHTKTLISQIWQNFKNLLLDRKLVFYNEERAEGGRSEYLRELSELQVDYESEYSMSVYAPQVEGKHDDYSDAIARMIWIATKNLTNKAIVFGSKTSFAGQSPNRAVNSAVQARMKARMSGSHDSRLIPRLSGRDPKR